MQKQHTTVLSQRNAPVQARSLKRVETILTTAAQLISEVGVDAATTSEIARRADISLASLYRYFPNKAAIIKAIAEQQLERLDAVYNTFIEDLDLDQGLGRLIDELATFYRNEPGYMEIWSGVQSMPELARIDREDFERHAGTITRRAAELFPEIDQNELKPIVFMVSRTIGSLVRQAMIMDRATADAMLEESKFMIKQYIDARLQSLLEAPH